MIDFNNNYLKILKDLISFNTISSDSNLELIEYVKNIFDEHQITYRIQYNENLSKANLLASIGPENLPGLLLSAHSDVVPVVGQKWDTNPFIAEIKNNKIYGRGSCDMKGFIAVILNYLIKLNKTYLSEPIHFLITYDEEIGCHGAKTAVVFLNDVLTIKPRYCIVGEPTNMTVISAHKGMYLLETEAVGKPCHSSTPDNGINAINAIMLVAGKINELAHDYKQKKSNDFYNFSVPWTTFNIGQITGGTAVNIVPEKAKLIWEYRITPDQEQTYPMNVIVKYCDALNLENKKYVTYEIKTITYAEIPGLSNKLNKELVNKVLAHLDSVHIGSANYCTEAGIFEKHLNIPTIICGPGSIDQAHRENEYVEVKQLERCAKFISDFIQSHFFQKNGVE